MAPKKQFQFYDNLEKSKWELLDIGINPETAKRLLDDERACISLGSFIVRYKDIRKADYRNYIWVVCSNSMLQKYSLECYSDFDIHLYTRTDEKVSWSALECCWFHQLSSEIIGVTSDYGQVLVKYPSVEYLKACSERIEQLYFYACRVRSLSKFSEFVGIGDLYALYPQIHCIDNSFIVCGFSHLPMMNESDAAGESETYLVSTNDQVIDETTEQTNNNGSDNMPTKSNLVSKQLNIASAQRAFQPNRTRVRKKYSTCGGPKTGSENSDEHPLLNGLTEEEKEIMCEFFFIN